MRSNMSFRETVSVLPIHSPAELIFAYAPIAATTALVVTSTLSARSITRRRWPIRPPACVSVSHTDFIRSGLQSRQLSCHSLAIRVYRVACNKRREATARLPCTSNPTVLGHLPFNGQY